LTGLAEICGGLGLLAPATRRTSAFGITAMLLLFLDVHQYMLRHSERFPEAPKWTLWARIPLQFVLIAWVLHYARSRQKSLPPADQSLKIDGQVETAIVGAVE
jgi:uncharacterized membrane protein